MMLETTISPTTTPRNFADVIDATSSIAALAMFSQSARARGAASSTARAIGSFSLAARCRFCPCTMARCNVRRRATGVSMCCVQR